MKIDLFFLFTALNYCNDHFHYFIFGGEIFEARVLELLRAVEFHIAAIIGH